MKGSGLVQKRRSGTIGLAWQRTKEVVRNIFFSEKTEKPQLALAFANVRSIPARVTDDEKTKEIIRKPMLNGGSFRQTLPEHKVFFSNQMKVYTLEEVNRELQHLQEIEKEGDKFLSEGGNSLIAACDRYGTVCYRIKGTAQVPETSGGSTWYYNYSLSDPRLPWQVRLDVNNLYQRVYEKLDDARKRLWGRLQNYDDEYRQSLREGDIAVRITLEGIFGKNMPW